MAGILAIAAVVFAFQFRQTVIADVSNYTQVDPTQPQVGPGIPQVGSNAPRSNAGSTKPGSLLFFHKYTSDAASPGAINTLLTITNTNPREGVAVRVFFVHDCLVEDVYITLVGNQSRTLTASKESAGQTGYAFAAAVNSQGLPTQFNWLIGNASLRDGRGHEASYNAFSVAKRSAGPVDFNAGGGFADIVFDNNAYDRLPKRVAIDNLQNQDEVTGPAVKTDAAIFSPKQNLSGPPPDPYMLAATAYDSAGRAYPQDSEFTCALYAGVSQLWTTPAFSAIIGANRPGWASFSARSGENAVPVLGLSLTDGVNSALHNARVMQTLEWLDSFRMTIPVRLPDNPVADVTTQDQPAAAGAATGASETKAGSILIYPRFASGDQGNSQLHLTNTHPSQRVRVRVFFNGLVDSAQGPAQVKEWIVTVQPQQTVALPANDLAPNQKGWVEVIAIDNRALPIQFNHLIGSAQVSELSGQRASFNAIAVAKNNPGPVQRTAGESTADVQFNDVNYDRLPATTAMAFVPSQVDNSTLLGFSRPAASLLEPPNTRALATVMLYDELLAMFGANVPRTENRLNQLRSSVLSPPITNSLQPGQHGWLKLMSSTPVFSWSLNLATAPFTAAANGSWRGGFNGDGNLHFLTVADSFTVKVPATNPNNHPPEAVAETIGLQVEARRSEGVIVRFDGSASSDEDAADPLTYQWLDNDLPVSSSRIADRKLGLGPHTIELIVTDGSGASSSMSQTVNVVDTTAPRISGIPSAVSKMTDSDSGEAITFALPVAYDMVDGAISVTASKASGSVFPLGRTIVTFLAKDNAGNESRATVEVTLTKGESRPQSGGVAGDKAPVMDNPNDQYVKPGTVRNVLLQATDADADPVTFSVLGAPPYAQIISGDPGGRNGTLRIAPGLNETVAATNVRVVANDGRGQTFTTLPFRIILSSEPNDDTGSGVGNNQPPVAVIAPLPAVIQATGGTGVEVTLDARGSRDPDGDPLSFTWFDGDAQIARGALATVNLTIGPHAIKLTVFDGKDGLTTTAPVRVEVTPRTLTIAGATPNVLDKNTTVTLTVTGTGFVPGAELQFTKEGLSVTNYVTVEEDRIVATVTVSATPVPGFRDVYVVNPTGANARLRSGIFVNR